MAKKVDTNQPEMVAALRRCGFHVMHTHSIGKGAPDLIVSGYRRDLDAVCALLVEVKHGSSKLTPDEQKWHSDYPVNGPLIIARSIDDILSWFGII